MPGAEETNTRVAGEVSGGMSTLPGCACLVPAAAAGDTLRHRAEHLLSLGTKFARAARDPRAREGVRGRLWVRGPLAPRGPLHVEVFFAMGAESWGGAVGLEAGVSFGLPTVGAFAAPTVSLRGRGLGAAGGRLRPWIRGRRRPVCCGGCGAAGNTHFWII